MMCQVNITKSAKEDIYGIYNYIANELLEKETAVKQINRIQAGILSLGNMPERHPFYHVENCRNLRLMSIDYYCIFYIVDRKLKEVTILRILYNKRNFQKILND